MRVSLRKVLPVLGLTLLMTTLFAAPPGRRVRLRWIRPKKSILRKVDLRKLRATPPGRTSSFRRQNMPELHRKFILKFKRSRGDPVVQKSPGKVLMPEPLFTFDGLDLANWGAGWPPDVNGDVGRSNVGADNRGYYIQVVNTAVGIFDKATGELVAAFTFDDLFDGTGTPCDDSNMGDPIVLYDRYLDRWLLTDYAFEDANSAPHYQCIAMSINNDPVSGGWYIWALNFENNDGVSSSSNVLNSYPKVGVWEDGYYFTFNDFDMDNGGSYLGVTIWALDKNSMAGGTLSGMLGFLDYSNDPYAWSLLPANAKSPTPPPEGSPEYLIAMGDDAWGGIDQDSLAIYKLDIDFQNAQGSISGPTVLEVASFDSNLCDYGDCVPQAGTSQKLDPLSSRLMHSAFYWNYGDHETIVVNHTVDAGGDHAGIRWYEIRDPGGTPTIYQQGTYAPDSSHRWMGSAACDASGNIAIGYSKSSPYMYPSIYYAGRKSSDPLGTLAQGEVALYQGGGSQTNSGRWGDYAALTVDPDDDLTFWYTNEYYSVTGSSWRTRIGKFKFAVEGDSPPSVSITTPSDGDTVSGAVTISASASDDYGIDRVEFYIDGILKFVDREAPYEFTWDSSSVVDGNHKIMATAYDTSNQASSHQITVSTDNGNLPMLVVDLDGNKNSCPYIKEELENKGYLVEYETSMPSYIDPDIPAVWVCLGIYYYNHVLSSTEGDTLKAYLDAGGKVYMEGGDTWCWDPDTSVHPYFGTVTGQYGYSCADGSGDLSTIEGISGTFTEGMSWAYGGENNYIDHLEANQSDSFNIWDNSSPSYYTGVARDNTTAGYKTIAASHEFGGAPSEDRADIIQKYLDFFFPPVSGPGPSVTFLYPHDNSPVYSVIWVRVKAEDLDGVSTVDFFLDDVYQTSYDCSGASSCVAKWRWDTTTASLGQHVIKVIAYDVASHAGSESITVDVHPGYGQHFGGAGDDIGYDIAINSQGDLLMVGDTTSISWRGVDMLLYVVNPNGSKEWHKNYGTMGEEGARAVAVDSSDNIFIAGYAVNDGQQDILVKKLTPAGEEIWSKTLGGSQDDAALAAAVLSNGDLVVAGYTASYTNGGYDAVVYRLSGEDGHVVFVKHLGGVADEIAYDVAVDSSDNVYIVGETSSFSVGGKDIALWKLSSEGVRLYGARFGMGGDDVGRDAIVAGGYLYIVGKTTSFTYGGWDLVVYKIDPEKGTKVSGRHFGGTQDDAGQGVAFNSDGKLVAVGSSYSFTYGGSDAVVYNLTQGLLKNWGKHLGWSEDDTAQAVITDSEGHIYVFGSTTSFTYGGYDFMLYRLSSTGVKLPVISH